MKRKAPETLLEFSDYIIPVRNKRRRLANDAGIDGWTDRAGQLLDSSETCSPIPSPNSSVDYSPVESPVNSSLDDSFEMESVTTSTPEASPKKSKKRNQSADEFDIELIIAHDPLCDKPMNCRTPLRILIRAIKWLVEHMRVHQKDVSDALGVSPSTFSLYMNNTPRQHGWRELERRLIDYVRHLVRPKQYPNMRPWQSSAPLLTRGWPNELLSPVYFIPAASCSQISYPAYYAEEGYITPLALGYNYLLDLRM